MPIYETIMIIHPDYTGDEKSAVIDKMKEVLLKGKAEFKKTEDWGVKRLSYPIKKQQHGHYFLFCYESKPEAVWEFERNIKINEGILKYMTVVLDKHEIARLEKELSEKKDKEELEKSSETAEEVTAPEEKAQPVEEQSKPEAAEEKPETTAPSE